VETKLNTVNMTAWVHKECDIMEEEALTKHQEAWDSSEQKDECVVRLDDLDRAHWCLVRRLNWNHLFAHRYLVWNTRLHGNWNKTALLTETRTFCTRKSPSFYPHEGTVTPQYLALSITDSVTLHCITLTLLGSTIKLQEPSQETRNWGLPVRINPPLARHTQTTDTTNNNYYKTYTISLGITLIGDGSLHNVGMVPDVQALVLTHVHIAQWLCSAHDQWRCSLS
jgi:hypothetical protein